MFTTVLFTRAKFGNNSTAQELNDDKIKKTGIYNRLLLGCKKN